MAHELTDLHMAALFVLARHELFDADEVGALLGIPVEVVLAIVGDLEVAQMIESDAMQ